MMNQSDKMQFNAQLRERATNMAVEVRNFLRKTEIEPIDRHIVNQVIRSSSSVAANYSAATRGRSDAEYFSKLCIVVEECDETLFWINYLVKISVLRSEETASILDEVEQLVRLFNSIKRKMREKIKGNQV